MRRGIPILLYHSVDERCSHAYKPWNIPPAQFAKQMSMIRASGFRSMTVSAYMAKREQGETIPDNTVLITFDDGLRDFLAGALPVLLENGLTATLFVVAGLVGKTSVWLAPLGERTRPMLDATELREVAEAGIEIGAHSYTHPQLDLLPENLMRDEITRSKSALEELTGRAVTSFAYPHGYANDMTRRLVREAGFRVGCRVRNAMTSAREDAFALSRINIAPELSPADILSIIRGRARLRVAPAVESLPIKGWRLVRSLKAANGGFGGSPAAEPVRSNSSQKEHSPCDP